jgi:RNA polymerase sigma-70 factor (ECF subfamily)
MQSDRDLKEVLLVKEMKNGNEGAFDFFFKYYYPGLCVFAGKRIKGSMEEAKNIVQDVFVKFWNDREKIDIRYSVRSYLFTSVKNKCIDFLKQSGHLNSLEEFPADPETGDEPYELYVLSELEQLFAESLQKLPDRCRLVFEMSRFDRKKNAEIAGILNISEKTVENQMSKALRILRHDLREYLPLLLLFEKFLFLK